MSETFALRVALYGPCREAAGTDEISLDVPVGCTVGRLLLRLEELSVGGVAGAAVAINRKYAAVDSLIDPDDEVAIIPPVAGG